MSTSRREVLISVSRLATAAVWVSHPGWAQQSPSIADTADLDLLAGIAYDILPYAELPPTLYVKAALQILDAKNKEVSAGLPKLREATHDAPWRDIEEAKRLAILTSMQETPFFRVVRANTLQVLLRDPATFAIVGYGGPSIQYGGYIARGFNDIKWLPVAPSP